MKAREKLSERSVDYQYQTELRRKRAYLRQAHNGKGMIDAKTLALELGVDDYRTAQRWAKSVNLRTVKVGRETRYDLDDLARVLLEMAVSYVG